MGQIVVSEFISLDGIVEDPGGAEPGSPADWTAGFGTGAEGDQLKLAELNAAAAQTYDAVDRRRADGDDRRGPSTPGSAESDTLPRHMATRGSESTCMAVAIVS